MTPIRHATSLVPVLVLLLARTAGAQSRPLEIVRDTPVLEFGGEIGFLNFMGWSLAGGHVTRNYADWLAGEVGFHGAPRDDKTSVPVPGYAMFIADVRL